MLWISRYVETYHRFSLRDSQIFEIQSLRILEDVILYGPLTSMEGSNFTSVCGSLFYSGPPPMSSVVFLLEDDWNEKIVVSEWAMSLSGLQNERMPDRWDNIGGKISTETQNKTALTEGTSIKTERK